MEQKDASPSGQAQPPMVSAAPQVTHALPARPVPPPAVERRRLEGKWADLDDDDDDEDLVPPGCE